MYIESYQLYIFIVIIIVVTPANADDDDDTTSVATAVGITFVLTLITFVPFTLIIVYIVYRIRKKKTTNEARVAITGSLMTERDTTIKSTCDDENYGFPENMKGAKNESRYQRNPIASIQPNPAYGLAQNTETIYEKVN